MKIMIVDDSATDRMIVQSMLCEYDVVNAKDGHDAMRQLEMNPDIGLLIVDLHMPMMDGFQLLEAIRSEERYAKLRAIILTNHDETDNEIKGLRLGAVDFIRKPIHVETLKARIDLHSALIHTQQLLEQKLYEQGITFDKIFMQVPIGIAISHSNESVPALQNRYFSINPAFEKISGRSKEELNHLGWAKITHPDDLDADLRNYEKLQAGEIDKYEMDKRFVKPDGSHVWVHMLVASLKLSEHHQQNHIALMTDITERKVIERALVESERSKSVLLSHLPGMAYRCLYDRNWTIQFVSAGCLELTGYPPESLVNNRDLSYNDIIAPEYQEKLWLEWEQDLKKRLPFSYEYEILTASGTRKWVLEKGQGIYNELGGVDALEGIVVDISDRKVIEDLLKYSSEHDRFTGLHNYDYLEKMLDRDATAGTVEKRALVSINLSSIQSLTAMYGFHYSQDLIRNVVKALQKHCTDTRMLFNTYENRFVFYVKGYHDTDELNAFCELMADNLEAILSIEGIGGGIGVVQVEKDSTLNADQMLRKLLIISEMALDLNERDFGICFYNADIESKIYREQELKRELNEIATEEQDGGLYLQYQPILKLGTNQICGFEALARLNSEQLGFVPPLEFIPMAEKTKLIIPIGEKVIRQALRFMKELENRGFCEIIVSVNVSILQLLQKDFYQNLLNMIAEMNVRPEMIGLEVTESIFASNYSDINCTLGKLKCAGLHISIDDFGTGYSSLSREWELNINCLKIDKSFVDNIILLGPDKSIVGDIISMAHKFEHSVVAEGVEQDVQKLCLRACGCDMIQGYLISRPMNGDVALKLLARQKTQGQ